MTLEQSQKIKTELIKIIGEACNIPADEVFVLDPLNKYFQEDGDLVVIVSRLELAMGITVRYKSEMYNRQNTIRQFISYIKNNAL